MGYVEQMVNEHVASGTGRRLKLGPLTGRNPHQTLALGRKRQIQHEKYGNPETKQPQPGEREEPEQYSLTYSPSSLPEVPDFYEQKYPDGFAGEWDGFKQRIDGSSLANFMRSLTNGIPSGGECPSWSLTFNFGAMGNFGTMVMQPPCIIWPFIKAVMILSALFVARRLVIGG